MSVSNPLQYNNRVFVKSVMLRNVNASKSDNEK